MIIKRLYLKDFGIYNGENEFIFTNDKSVVLIGGMNGRGKTTFLEAVLLALYGSNSFAYKESDFNNYGRYLDSFVNKNSVDQIASIELDFTLENNGQVYTVVKSWKGNTLRTAENVTVKLNGEVESFLTEHWNIFIENELPSELSRFFFFDGEKISKLIGKNINTQMKESIKALLGISVLDTLDHDIERILKNITTEKNDFDLEESDRLKKQRQVLEQELQNKESSMNELSNQLDSLRKILEEKETNFKKKGGEVTAQREQQIKKRSDLELLKEQCQKKMLDLSSNEMPLLLVKKNLESINEKVAEEYQASFTQSSIQWLDDKILAFVNESGKNTQESQVLENFMEFIKADSKVLEKNQSIFQFSEKSRMQLEELLNNKFEEVQKNIANLNSELKEYKKEIENINNYLDLDIDQEDLQNRHREIIEINQKIARLEQKKCFITQERNELEKSLKSITLKVNQSVEKLLKNMEERDEDHRLIKYSSLATKILAVFKERLQNLKLEELSKTIAQCYLKIANKKNLISEVRIDPQTLNLHYFDSNSKEIHGSSLSAGEKQLMIISLLWALAICSKKQLPVIIDTPLSRLDSNHRYALIDQYFPYISKQTILLSTDTEIDHGYFLALKENIGDSFTIKYDQETKSSRIEKGYFGWE
ncbi:DNA sulfur modification protein DndD [Dubosiella newyorkensis]|uniref:Nuclease SbcCD subunit C n=1 Tax=Dubosiella newyorkensis TaxID=1862672 RepID=A0A1U7NPH2_9FIRM|nr:DNA sulfur modification protein DndD [Dubosiella newyorkensis]OLU47532.1 DNA sulfur modification protein DndD [Dubosiella newyorkensis]